MNIRIYGNEVLSKKAEPVEKITPELVQLLDEMVPFMRNSHGVGLAAAQIGISKRFFVMDARDGVRKVINPEILKMGSTMGEEEEGCLSVPGIHKKVRRPRKISVKYMDETGKVIEEELKNYTARVFQHEYDHLDGILFTDRLGPIAKKMISGELDRLKTKSAESGLSESTVEAESINETKQE